MRYLCLLLLLLACTACQRSVNHNDIQFALAQMPMNLDPRQATDASSERVNRLLYQPLVDFDAASKPMPVLTSWRALDDKTYRFTLKRERASFVNGDALTAEDVVATYRSLVQHSNFPHAADFSNLSSVQAEGDDVVVFHLNRPDVHFTEKLIIGILPKKLVEADHDFAHQPIGSGAFQFVSWGNELKLQRRSDHLQISLQEVKDPTVRVLKLKRGETDLLQGDLPPELVKYLQTQPNIEVSTSVGANFSYIGLNLQDPILRELKVRQAIAHAIDRQAIVEKIMVQNTRLGGAILPPEHYAGNGDLQTYDYNPTLSRQLLREAGVALPLKLVYKTSTDAQRVRIATILQAQMQAAGIQLEIRSMDWGTFFEDVKKGNFQLYGLTWVGIKTPEIYTKAFGSQSVPPAGFNRGRYADEQLDKLLAKEDWQAATQRIHAQLPYIPLWYEGQFAAMQKNITNYSPKPDGNWDDLTRIELAHPL